jgi:hypothetical protein
MSKRRKLSTKYFSQDPTSCGDDVETACGPVSLANSLVGRACPGRIVTPARFIHIAFSTRPDLGRLRDRLGMSPSELCALSAIVGQSHGLQAKLREPCSVEELARGDLMYVKSVALKNAQGGVQFEAAEYDSHIVMVESFERNAIVVINPDCRKSGRGFRHDGFGRMRIPLVPELLNEVWCSLRRDGIKTTRAAVLLRPKATTTTISSSSSSSKTEDEGKVKPV